MDEVDPRRPAPDDQDQEVLQDIITQRGRYWSNRFGRKISFRGRRLSRVLKRVASSPDTIAPVHPASSVDTKVGAVDGYASDTPTMIDSAYGADSDDSERHPLLRMKTSSLSASDGVRRSGGSSPNKRAISEGSDRGSPKRVLPCRSKVDNANTNADTERWLVAQLSDHSGSTFDALPGDDDEEFPDLQRAIEQSLNEV